jgi:hypothetical protein
LNDEPKKESRKDLLKNAKPEVPKTWLKPFPLLDADSWVLPGLDAASDFLTEPDDASGLTLPVDWIAVSGGPIRAYSLQLCEKLKAKFALSSSIQSYGQTKLTLRLAAEILASSDPVTRDAVRNEVLFWLAHLSEIKPILEFEIRLHNGTAGSLALDGQGPEALEKQFQAWIHEPRLAGNPGQREGLLSNEEITLLNSAVRHWTAADVSFAFDWAAALYPKLLLEMSVPTLASRLLAYWDEYPTAVWAPWQGLAYFAGFIRLDQSVRNSAKLAELAALDWATYQALFSPHDELSEELKLKESTLLVNPAAQIVAFSKQNQMRAFVRDGRKNWLLQQSALQWQDAAAIDELQENPRITTEHFLATMNGKFQSDFEPALNRMIKLRLILRGRESV